MKPLAIDLFCGLGGWTEGFLAEGYRVIGFDIERHDYGTGGYPGQLVIQDVLTLHGSQFKDAAVIVASPPCQAYSYRAMPWSRAKALPPPSNELFEACFRIQREAIAAWAAAHPCPDCGMSTCEGIRRVKRIPLIVENVRGAQKWVGQAKWHFGSFYLWGDVPALMPPARSQKIAGQDWNDFRKAGKVSPHWRLEGLKISASCSERRWEDREVKRLRDNFGWAGSVMREGTSHGAKRKAASAQIAKIPFPLAQHIAKTFKAERLLEQAVTI